MLQILVPDTELFDDEKQRFISVKATELKLEHSLLSISKWEAKWKESFLSTTKRSHTQSIDYVKCMTLNPPVDDNVYSALTQEAWDKIKNYIDADLTATWFHEDRKTSAKQKQQIVTSELLYYYMVSYNIPFECQKWHLSRLLTLIKICDVKAQEADKKNKMSKSEIITQNKALNEKRRRELNSKG